MEEKKRREGEKHKEKIEKKKRGEGRRLRRAGLGSSVLTSFYRCVVESVLCSSINVSHRNCSAADRKALQRVVKAAQRQHIAKVEGEISVLARPLTGIWGFGCARDHKITPGQSKDQHLALNLPKAGRKQQTNRSFLTVDVFTRVGHAVVRTTADQVQEIRIEANEDNLTDVRTRIGQKEKEIAFLEEKTDDLENRSRRSNVKIVNISEKAEGNDAFGYVERLLPQLFGEEHFPAPVVIERAHHLGKAVECVRPILVKFLNYRDKDKVLRLVRNRGTVYLDTNRISFYPDYSIEVQRRMAAFNEVKKKLQEKNTEYASRYPAKLRIRHREEFLLFSTPSEIENFLVSLEEDQTVS
ncbi:hypothetical protein NFI96_005441 [Prochilodus magdalenae]|nr:hypothetical protein NFI96_005441 [Prochilodus magdalenae]